MVFDEIERQHNLGRDNDFISKIITGGDNYNSTEIFVNKLIHKNSIDVNQLIILIHSLIVRIQEEVKDIGMINIVNEYVELFYLCMYENINILKSTTDWMCINKFIKEYIKTGKPTPIQISNILDTKALENESENF